MSAPTFIYKLVPLTVRLPDEIPNELPLSELDASSGFIHLSTASQVPGTLRHFFASDDAVYVLRIAYEHIRADIRWEDPQATVCGDRNEEGMFPHLYNTKPPKLGKNEVESVRLFRRVGDVWDMSAVAEAQGWLVD